MCRLCSLQSAPALLQTVSSFTFQQHNVFMCYSSWFHTHLLAQVRSTNQLPSREPTQSFVEIWEVCMSAPLQASVIYPHTITPFPARSAETFRCIFAGVSFQASSLQTTGMSTCFFNASEKKKKTHQKAENTTWGISPSCFVHVEPRRRKTVLVFLWMSAFKFDNLFHHIAPLNSQDDKKQKKRLNPGAFLLAAGCQVTSALQRIAWKPTSFIVDTVTQFSQKCFLQLLHDALVTYHMLRS